MASSPERSRVERCALCGAPLSDVMAYVVTCHYCHEENRLVAKETEDAQRQAEAVTKAAGEAQAMARRLSQRREELEAEFGEAMTDFTSDSSPSKGAAALHAYEALLRIIQAPSVHIAQVMGPSGESVLRQIDDGIEDALSNFAADNGITRA
ncbi:MAG: hypothetical protein AB8H86_21410 [Polyangiales bacterium]